VFTQNCRKRGAACAWKAKRGGDDYGQWLSTPLVIEHVPASQQTPLMQGFVGVPLFWHAIVQLAP
jgi:hypothetical protein